MLSCKLIHYPHSFFLFQNRAIIKTRDETLEVIKDQNLGLPEEEEAFKIQLPEMPELSIDIPKQENASLASGPKLYVRDDGTVDWDGALQDREALKKFGGAVWARINGQNADDLDDEDGSVGSTGGHVATEKPVVTAKIEDTPAIRQARDELNRLQKELADMQRAHTALLSSGAWTVFNLRRLFYCFSFSSPLCFFNQQELALDKRWQM